MRDVCRKHFTLCAAPAVCQPVPAPLHVLATGPWRCTQSQTGRWQPRGCSGAAGHTQLRADAFAHWRDDAWYADVDNARMLLKGGCVIPLCFECMCLQGPASLQGPLIGPVAVLLVPSSLGLELLM